MRKVFKLNFIPPPEGWFGPEEARQWLEVGQPELGANSPSKNGGDENDLSRLTAEDKATMALACTEVIASNWPVVFEWHLDEILELIRNLDNPYFTVSDKDRDILRDLGSVLLPTLDAARVEPAVAD